MKSLKARKVCVCKSVAFTPQSLQYEKTKVQMPEKSVRIGVLGASGYTGSEVSLSRNQQDFVFFLLVLY